MRGLVFDEAYASTLGRAIRTVRIVLEANHQMTPLMLDHRLIEKSWGDLEGESRYDHEEEREKCLTLFDHAPPNGESYSQVRKRVVACYNEVLLPSLLKGNNLLVGSHSGSSSQLMCYLENLSWENREQLAGLSTGGTATYHVTRSGATRIA